MIAAWKEFANSLPVSENYLKTIMATLPTCSGNEIMLDIITPSQAMIAEHQGLIEFLRQRLANPTIIIKTRLVETEAQATAATFTSKQKLDVMISDNKSLKNMIEKFGLSFDY